MSTLVRAALMTDHFVLAEEEAEAFYAKRTEINRKINPNFEGAITVEKSAGDILALIEKATIADSGKFVHRDGRDADYF